MTLTIERSREVSGILLALPLAGLPIALVLWATSVPWVDMSNIGDYGLIPLLPFNFWLALAVLLVSFSVLVRRVSTPTPLLVSHVLTLVAP